MRENYEEVVPKERLDESRLLRRAIIAKYGFVPESVIHDIKYVKDPKLDLLVEDTVAEKEGDYRKHGFSVRNGALSQFPTGIAKFGILMWGEPGGLLFDPFCERLPRLIIGNMLGMNVIGYDISRWFMEHNIKKLKKRVLAARTLDPDNNFIISETEDSLEAYYQGKLFAIYRRDSRKIHLENSSVDFIFTSPPYWDLEYYGDEPEQLGMANTYKGFLIGLKQVLKECYRILKPNKFIVVNVNDFRKDRVFYLYHVDVCNIMKEIGFKPHDLVIFRYSAHSLGAIFLSQMEEQRRTAKCHEYLLVFRK